MSFGDLPALAPGMMQDLQAALDELRLAAEAAERARLEEERLALDLASIEVDGSALADADAIEELFQASGGYKSDKRDLPGVQREADGFHAALERHARSLGLSDIASLESARPTEARKSEARKLIKQGRATEASAEAIAAQLLQAQKSYQDARIAREAEGAELDPAPLREKYAALGKVAELAGRVAESRIALTKDTLDLTDSAARLDPPVADLEALARQPIPRGEDLAQFADLMEAASRAVRDAAMARQGVEKEIDGTTGSLAQLAAGRPLATAERRAEARARREAAWGRVRAAIFGEPEAPARASLVARLAEFERVYAEADRLTDDAIEDASRLAQHGLRNPAARRTDAPVMPWRRPRRRARQDGSRTPSRAGETFGSRVCAVRIRRRECGNGPAASSIDEDARQARSRGGPSSRRRKPSSRASSRSCAPSSLEAGLSEIEGLDVHPAGRARSSGAWRRSPALWERSRDLESRLAEARRRLARSESGSRRIRGRAGGLASSLAPRGRRSRP